MTEIPATRPQRPPTHPGVLIDEILDDHLRLSIPEAARRVRVSRQSLHAVVTGRAVVTPAMALRIGKLFGKDPSLWLHMQARYDLWVAERQIAAELSQIETLDSA